jgi:hypothetical protein
MGKIGPLEPGQASRTLVARLVGTRDRVGVVDRARQVATRLGARPDRVFLVWTRSGGEEPGEGDEVELARLEILPTPKVSDRTAVALNPYSAGRLPAGAVRVTEISAGRHREALLAGRELPDGKPAPKGASFFFEVVDDGRDGNEPERRRFRLAASPTRGPNGRDFEIVLERASADRTRVEVKEMPRRGLPPRRSRNGD